jgi:hypothetical protein
MYRRAWKNVLPHVGHSKSDVFGTVSGPRKRTVKSWAKPDQLKRIADKFAKYKDWKPHGR